MMRSCFVCLALLACAEETIRATPPPNVAGAYTMQGPLLAGDCASGNPCAATFTLACDVTQSSGSIVVTQTGAQRTASGTYQNGSVQYVVPSQQANIAGCIASATGVATLSPSGTTANGTLNMTFTPPCDGSANPSCYCSWTVSGERVPADIALSD